MSARVQPKPPQAERHTNHITGAQAMVQMLMAYNVTHMFGLCGDTTLPFYDALAQIDHNITHILTRDERHAAYMADGYARVTGKPGICEAPSGGGATYTLPGLVEAHESSIPILAVTSDIATTARGRYALTELDQPTLFQSVTKWNASLDNAAQLPALVRAAFRAMTTGRPGAAQLTFPFDTQKAPLDPQEIWADPQHRIFPAQPVAADPRLIAQAAQALMGARKAVAICGGGVIISDAMAALEELAQLLNLPIATTVSGQGAIAETHSHAVGVVGSNGWAASTRAVVDQADLVIFIGCRAGSVTTERWNSPKIGTPIIHIDSDPQVVGANYPTQFPIIADARLALEALLKALRHSPSRASSRPDFDGRARAGEAWAHKNRLFHERAAGEESPIRPERVIAALYDILDDDAIIAADPGTPCPYFSAYYRWKKPGRHFITNRAHGALGYALAASIGAHFGRPTVKTIAAMGDGSFGFSCGELETLVRYRLPITVIVFSNGCYGWIKAGQNSGFAQRFYNVDFTALDHAAIARGFGITSWSVRDPGTLAAVLRQAIHHPGPTLVDITSQPLHEADAPVSEWIS